MLPTCPWRHSPMVRSRESVLFLIIICCTLISGFLGYSSVCHSITVLFISICVLSVAGYSCHSVRYLILDLLLFCSVPFIALSPSLSTSTVYLLYCYSSVHSVAVLYRCQFSISLSFCPFKSYLSAYVTPSCCSTVSIYCCVCY